MTFSKTATRCLMIAFAAMAGIHGVDAAFVPTMMPSSLVRTNRAPTLVTNPAFFPSPRQNTVPLNLFFGKDKSADHDELKKFPKLGSDTKFESLSLYIQTWSKQTFTEDGGKKSGLTTPVTLIMLPDTQSSEDDNVVAVSGVQLVFKPTKTGNAYTSKNEEKAQENGGGSQKKKPKKEGGVEIIVEKLKDGQVQVRARRCELDEDTMIKSMSEETILGKLNSAVKAWKKL